MSTDTNENTRKTQADVGQPADRPRADTPGPLRGESWLTIQTREAQRLVTGRPADQDKPAIIGLTRFGVLMSQLYFAARLDDPYVDWWLVQLEDTLAAGNSELNALQIEAKALLDSIDAMHIEVALSAQPVKMPLQFNNPYSYRAAILIGEYDKLICTVLTGRHTGLIDRHRAERLKHLGGTVVRRCLATPTTFPKGIVASREDIRQHSARAKQAIERYGLPPAAILSGEERGELAPAILNFRDPRLRGSASAALDQANSDELDPDKNDLRDSARKAL